MDIAAWLASVKPAMDVAKALKDINKSFDEAVYKSNIADLTEKLSDARLALIEAKEQAFEKDKEIGELKRLQIERGHLVEGEGGYRYRADGNGAPLGFPMCPKCDPVDGRLIQLVEDKAGNAAICPACASQFKPVTCYLPAGGTLREQQVAERNRKSEEMNRRMQSARRNSSWMA
jgi:hypothetical protein